MKNAGKARSYGLYRHLRTSKEIIENLLNYYSTINSSAPRQFPLQNGHQSNAIYTLLLCFQLPNSLYIAARLLYREIA